MKRRMIGGKNMNWIDEITEEILGIRSSPKELKKFGLTIGGILLVLGIAGGWILSWNMRIVYMLLFVGVVLVSGGIFSPKSLQRTYRYWMSFAIVMGSIVSRIILFFVFFCFVTPISIIAKITGKKFSASTGDQRSTYWIQRDKQKKIDYERMS